MKVTTKCQIGFWGHFLKVRWHCNRASHHCREVQYYIANTICLNILVLVLLSFHVVNSIPEVLQEICMHINLCMCTASPTYGIVFTCVVYKYPTIVIQWTFYTLNFQWLSIIIHSIIIICQAFCQSFCFAVGISSIRSVGPFLVQHSSCTLRASAIIQTLRIAFFMHTFRNKIYSEFCTPNFLLIYYCIFLGNCL